MAAVQVRWAATDIPGDARVLLRSTVSELIRRPLHAVVVRQECDLCGGPHGRPRLEVDGGPGPWASIARTPGLTVVAVASAPVGVDVEVAREPAELEDLARVALSDDERGHVAGLHPSARSEAVLRAWVRKEAVLKCTGHGLTIDPAVVELDPGGALVRWGGPGRRPSLRVADVPLRAGTVAAVARAGRRAVRLEGREVVLSPPD